ncbi:MAG: hypothetical protein H9893_03770 [Candidatus Niameybacter stercoravium]|nr:hypothetical protein [Candidatus Niameybacter stercoravium]
MNTIKRYLFLPIFISLLVFPHLIYASSTSSIDNDLQAFYNSIRQIQKQFTFVAENAYVNKIQGNPNDDLQKLLDSTEPQTSALSSQLSIYNQGRTLSNNQQIKLRALQTSIDYLNFFREILTTYINSSDPHEQYSNINLFHVANSLLNFNLQSFITP